MLEYLLLKTVTDPSHPQLGEGRSSSIQLYAKRPGLGVFFMEAPSPPPPPSLTLALAQSLLYSVTNSASSSASTLTPTRRTGT